MGYRFQFWRHPNHFAEMGYIFNIMTNHTQTSKDTHRHPQRHPHTDTDTQTQSQTQTHTHTDTHTHTHTHTYIHTHTHKHTHTQIHTHRYTHILLYPFNTFLPESITAILQFTFQTKLIVQINTRFTVFKRHSIHIIIHSNSLARITLSSWMWAS